MKIKNIFKITAMSAIVLAVFCSCSDFLTIYPTDKTVGEDFWKTKEDVEGMVTGAYTQMLSYGCQERAILWGAYRSDELVKYSDYSSTALENISAVNLLPTISYTSWGNFYSVINRCNIVLNHAPDVMELDPKFTQGDYDEIRAQMLALRSLCYFYLVRAFRDVPYTTQSYEDDDQVFVVPQVAPDSVLQYCINDLEEAERYIMKSGAYGLNNWRNKGYMTRDAVYALMADIYLWRASMTKNRAYYDKCIEYADKLIDSKDEYYRTTHVDRIGGSQEDKYHLADLNSMYNIFSTIFGNQDESILEWQYDGSSQSNTALLNYYNREGDNDHQHSNSMIMASQVFNFPDEAANTLQGRKIYHSKNDYRYWQFVYGVNNEEATELSIRKFIATSGVVNGEGSSTGNDPTGFTRGEPATRRNYNGFSQNWIVYRLTDVMLMKAEALVQTAASDSDHVVLDEAFNLVQKVNKRAMKETATDTLLIENFKGKEAMELLVLAERERELCFEGKRWFDLVRFCYRHMEGVDVNKKLADATDWPTLYSPMLQLIVRKYVNGGDAVSYKMKSEPYLYWPIQYSETLVNNLLKQNPVFQLEKSTSKN
ncbi:MAG: RagB/SusD family nutrient uptake outer membrane protein [Prevotella sp.]|nr:RagB/SusD family nutrient uptake outer membrane protein [Prevotella sp.]